MSNMETFISHEGTRYILNPSDMIVPLTQHERDMLRFKVRLMSDAEILNQTSGNGTTMGIPISLSRDRLKEIRETLLRVLKRKPTISLSDHAIERIFEDSLLEDDDPEKRGWAGTEDAVNCLTSAEKVISVRLNVDHTNPSNTKTLKYLRPQLSIRVQGSKAAGKGNVVSAILSQNHIEILTVL